MWRLVNCLTHLQEPNRQASSTENGGVSFGLNAIPAVAHEWLILCMWVLGGQERSGASKTSGAWKCRFSVRRVSRWPSLSLWTQQFLMSASTRDLVQPQHHFHWALSKIYRPCRVGRRSKVVTSQFPRHRYFTIYLLQAVSAFILYFSRCRHLSYLQATERRTHVEERGVKKFWCPPTRLKIAHHRKLSASHSSFPNEYILFFSSPDSFAPSPLPTLFLPAGLPPDSYQVNIVNNPTPTAIACANRSHPKNSIRLSVK